MKKVELLRVYDSREPYTNYHECYFVVLPKRWDWDRDMLPLLSQIAGMPWQAYTSYLIGDAEVSEDELFWSEITGYELKECKIHIDRVSNIKKYKLPEW